MLILDQTSKRKTLVFYRNRFYFSFIKVHVIRPANGNLAALESKLGYLLVLAKPMNPFQILTFTMNIFSSQEAKPINSTLNKFLKTKPFQFLDNKDDYVLRKIQFLKVVNIKSCYHSDHILILFTIITYWQKKV